MKKVLFVIPDKSYKSQDFVNSANKLGIDMVIITDSEQAAQQLGAKNIFSMEFDTLSKEKLNDLPQDIKLALPVDHSSVLFASKIVEELGVEGNSIAIGFGPTPISQGDEIRLAAPTNIWGHVIENVGQLTAVPAGAAINVECAD